MRTFEPAPGLRAEGSESVYNPEPPIAPHPVFYEVVSDGRGGWILRTIPRPA